MALITFIGRLGKDPEQVKDNIVKINVAEKCGKDYTHWHNCTCFDRMASFSKQYLKKGSYILVSGETRYNKPSDFEYCDVTVHNISFINSTPQTQEKHQDLSAHASADHGIDDSEIPF